MRYNNNYIYDILYLFKKKIEYKILKYPRYARHVKVIITDSVITIYNIYYNMYCISFFFFIYKLKFRRNKISFLLFPVGVIICVLMMYSKLYTSTPDEQITIMLNLCIDYYL